MTMPRSFLARGKILPALMAFGLAQFPSAAQACSACMGDPNSNEASAINAAIFLMLGCIGGVLGLFIAFGIYLYRRAQLPIPPHVELAEMIGTQSK
jgi:hypothetical protein